MQKATSVWGNDKSQYFNQLGPEKVLDAIESLGYKTTGRVLQLASMENRVFEVEIYNDESKTISDNFKIIKFYRPGRWSFDQIKDEHQFLLDLIDAEITAIAPVPYDGETLFKSEEGLFFAVFPKQGGRACDEWTPTLLEQMGRLLARLHSVGRRSEATQRLKLNIENFGKNNLPLILNSGHLPIEYQESYKNICEMIFQTSGPICSHLKLQRIHGDCHHGNILLQNGTPFLIDFDDMSVGPVVQDIWMITPGRDFESIQKRNILLEAYESMSYFDRSQLKVIEVLRALRIIHFSAWIAHRYEDQSFKRAFPDFGTSSYWEKELNDLRMQLSYIQESHNNYGNY